MAVQRYLAMLTTLALTGCGAMPNLSMPDIKARNDFKGKPLSAVTSQLGYPEFQQTYAGQKIYTWRRGTAAQECLIKVVMAGDIVDSYDTSGDPAICSPYLAPAQPVPAQ
jgi:hypothetical protein